MAKLLVAPVSAGLDVAAASKAFVQALGAQVFQPLDASAETLLAQGKSDDWFDALVGEVAALDSLIADSAALLRQHFGKPDDPHGNELPDNPVIIE